jgi:NADPH:quinone reductase-like Zn-dependent oxidoreductase
LVVHFPDTWSFEDAAQLGIAPFTALRTLYDMLELPLPLGEAAASAATATATAANPQKQTPILVGGGATSVGQYVVQFAKLSGLYVIATASERNFSLVRSLGADVVVDYRDPVAAAKQIREAAPNLQYATDCVTDGTSPAIVAASLAGQGTLAHITTLPYPSVEGVRVLSSVVFDFLGKVRAC